MRKRGSVFDCKPDFEFPEFDPSHPEIFEAECRKRWAAMHDRRAAERAAEERAARADARRRELHNARRQEARDARQRAAYAQDPDPEREP